MISYPDHTSRQHIIHATTKLKDKACSMIAEFQRVISKKMQLLSSGFLSASDFELFLRGEYQRLQEEKQQAILRFERDTDKLDTFLQQPTKNARRVNAALAAYCVVFDNELISAVTDAVKQWWLFMQGEYRYPELYVYLEEAFLPIKQRCANWVFDSES